MVGPSPGCDHSRDYQKEDAEQQAVMRARDMTTTTTQGQLPTAPHRVDSSKTIEKDGTVLKASFKAYF